MKMSKNDVKEVDISLIKEVQVLPINPHVKDCLLFAAFSLQCPILSKRGGL